MSDTLYRATPVDLEIRGEDQRTIAGLAVPFDEPAEVRDGNGRRYVETFRRGAFAKTTQDRAQAVKLLVAHDHMNRLPIGAAQVLREDTRGLYGEFLVSKTREGDEALELVRDSVLDSMSVGFVPVKDKNNRDGSIDRIEVKLREVSVVAWPAYKTAKVLAVRADGHTADRLSRSAALLRINELESQ